MAYRIKRLAEVKGKDGKGKIEQFGDTLVERGAQNRWNLAGRRSRPIADGRSLPRILKT